MVDIMGFIYGRSGKGKTIRCNPNADKSEQTVPWYAEPWHSEQAIYRMTLHWIQDMILYGKIRLTDIPQEIRIASKGIYVTAFRVSNKISCERYVEDLQILCNDLSALKSDDPSRTDLVRLLSGYLTINDHKKEDGFLDFQKNIHEEILRELRRDSEATQSALRQQLKNIGIT